MKFSLPNFSIGEKVNVRVVERVSNYELIVSFYGDLVRVSNMSGRRFNLNDSIELVVTNRDPLSFRMADSVRPTFEKTI